MEHIEKVEEIVQTYTQTIILMIWFHKHTIVIIWNRKYYNQTLPRVFSIKPSILASSIRRAAVTVYGLRCLRCNFCQDFFFILFICFSAADSNRESLLLCEISDVLIYANEIFCKCIKVALANINMWFFFYLKKFIILFQYRVFSL